VFFASRVFLCFLCLSDCSDFGTSEEPTSYKSIMTTYSYFSSFMRKNRFEFHNPGISLDMYENQEEKRDRDEELLIENCGRLPRWRRMNHLIDLYGENPFPLSPTVFSRHRAIRGFTNVSPPRVMSLKDFNVRNIDRHSHRINLFVLTRGIPLSIMFENEPMEPPRIYFIQPTSMISKICCWFPINQIRLPPSKYHIRTDVGFLERDIKDPDCYMRRQGDNRRTYRYYLRKKKDNTFEFVRFLTQKWVRGIQTVPDQLPMMIADIDSDSIESIMDFAMTIWSYIANPPPRDVDVDVSSNLGFQLSTRYNFSQEIHFCRESRYQYTKYLRKQSRFHLIRWRTASNIARGFRIRPAFAREFRRLHGLE
jgi:hypothetical protein